MDAKLIIDFISTGDEVLTGEIDDTNASWVSRFLLDRGVTLTRRYTVADDLFELVSVFEECSHRADIVIVNGGLGPTEDDLSAQALAQALKQPLVIFEDWVAQMKIKFERMGHLMSESNIKQAQLPKTVQVIDNPVGTACGFKAKLNRAYFYFTPGVPHEFKEMVTNPIWGDIEQRFELGASVEVKRYFTFGFAESDLVSFLQPLQLPKSIALGYRAAMPFIEIKLTAVSGPLLEEKAALLVQLLGDRLAFQGESSLAKEIQHSMIAVDKKLVLAESCTAGLIASTLVAEAGSSAYVDRGFVTYSCDSKHQQLGVTRQDLQEFGAVSEVVAQAMAEGALENSDADIALSVTGVAGPSDEYSPNGGVLPPGRVIFALAQRDGETSVVSCQLRFRSRNQVRKMAAAFALDMLRRHLSGLPVKSDLKYVL